MKKFLLLFAVLLLFGLVFTGCASPSVAEEQPVSARPDPKQSLAEGEKLFQNRTELSNARKAVEVLAKARDPEKRDFELEWKFARYSYFLGHATENETEATKVLSAGISAARIARRMQEDRPEGHFWYAAILGEQSKRSPVTVGIVSKGKIQEAMKRVIEIDPKFQGASAYDALGQVEMASRGMAGGDLEKAIEYFEKAIELDDDNSYTRLHIAEAYFAAGRKADARKHLDHLLNMKAKPEFIAEFQETLRDAKKLLETKF